MREVRGEEALILIIGNKKDLEDDRAVQFGTATEEFKKLGLTFMEVSAKSGANVKEFFKDLAYMTAMGKKSKDEPSKPAQPAQPQPTNTVNLTAQNHRAAETDSKKKKGCC